MLQNEEIRIKLEKYLKKYGIKQKHISKITKISQTSISLFVQKKRQLSQRKLSVLNNFVEGKLKDPEKAEGTI